MHCPAASSLALAPLAEWFDFCLYESFYSAVAVIFSPEMQQPPRVELIGIQAELVVRYHAVRHGCIACIKLLITLISPLAHELGSHCTAMDFPLN